MLALLAGAALACSTNWGWAQITNFVVDRFNDPSEISNWSHWWGSPAWTLDYDSTVDAGGGTTPGSMKITVAFDPVSYPNDNQFAFVTGLGGQTISLVAFTNLVMDLKWDASSPTNSGGNYGYFEYGVRFSDYSQNYFGHLNVPVTNGWIHLVAPIDPTMAKIDQVTGITFKMWAGTGLAGTATFWVDNIILNANTNPVIPPPQMTLGPVSNPPGLTIVASAPGQYPRQNVATANAMNPTNGMVNNTYSWVGYGATPVTYSFTVASFPNTNYPGFQAQMFLAPQAGMPYGANDNSIDWNAANLVFVQLVENNDGSATARFMYKTNDPSANAMLWNTNPTNGPVGTLGTVVSTNGPLGTWSVTFLNDTNVTLTAPGGASTSFSLTEDAASLFADPLYAYFGNQPNNPSSNTSLSTGQSTTFSRIQIQGVATPLDDHFPGPGLNPDPTNPNWQVVAADPTGVFVVGADDIFWLSWSLPDLGFSLQANTNLTATSWFDPGLTNTVTMGKVKKVLISKDSLPGAQSGFYRMVKPGQ